MIAYRPLILKPEMKTILFSLITVLLLSCKTQAGGDLKPSDFGTQIQKSDVKLVDVRTPSEFSEGHIKGAINVDYNGADFATAMAQFGKEEKIYLYCKSGVRSGKALEQLQKLGFKNLYSLHGGIEAWKGENLPIETGVASAALSEQKPLDFKTAIYGDKLVLVDFNATWCGPCKRMQPFIDMIKEERAQDVIVYSIDTDEQVDLAREYQIMNLPTVILLKKGSVLYRKEGYHEQKELNDIVTKYK